MTYCKQANVYRNPPPLRDAMRRKVRKDGFFCTTRWYLKSIFGASAVFPGLDTALHFPVSATKKCTERTTIRECREKHCKSDESTDRGIENNFQECFKNFTIVGKSVSLPKGTTLTKKKKTNSMV
jgi:hypothetical protein